MEELSEYERLRLEHIKRNQEMLVRLGLFDDTSENKAHGNNQSRAKAAEAKQKRVRIPRQPLENLRRSARIKKQAPEFSGEEIDQEEHATKRRKVEEEGDDEEEERVRQEILETTMNVSSDNNCLLKMCCLFKA